MDTNIKASPTDSDSPPESATVSSDIQETDVTAESSPASPDVNEEPSPSQGDKPPTLADAIANALGDAKEPDEEPATSPVEEKAEAEKSDDEPEAKQDEPAPEVKKDDLNLDALSKKAQNRFRELTKENAEMRAVVDEIKRYTVDEQGFNNYRELLRNYAENPKDAVPMLEQALQDARERAGLVVKEPEIQQKLDEGLIDEPTALELQQARLARQDAERRQKMAEMDRQNQLVKAQESALIDWARSKQERDPAFDSIRTLVRDRVAMMAVQRFPTSVEEAVANAQKAYEEVTAELKPFLPAKKVSKVTPSSGSSTKASARPRTLEEVIARTLNQ